MGVAFDREAALADGALMCNYLPLLRECLPEVAADVEEDLATLVAQTEKGVAWPYSYYSPVLTTQLLCLELCYLHMPNLYVIYQQCMGSICFLVTHSRGYK